MSSNFSFYTVDEKYCNFLRSNDPCVPYNNANKSSRPFVGIVLEIGDFKYYAPLTSPKPKHLTMKNQRDFIKICKGSWGAINLNNMIPVCSQALHTVNMTISASDTKDERDYKNLLSNQLSWCNSNRDLIKNKAEKLYRIVSSESCPFELRNRCCNFKFDEKKCEQYEALNPSYI